MSEVKGIYIDGKVKEVKTITHTLENLQKLVHGYIQDVYLPNGLVLICDEEGKIKEDTKPNLVILNSEQSDVIMNPCFIVGFNGCDDICDLTEEQIEWVNDRCFWNKEFNVYYFICEV